MDEDSLSRDCEPFFESDGEEESTDGKRECHVHKHIFLHDLYVFVNFY